MTVRELINRLKTFNPDIQVLIGIDRSAGFTDDYIDAYEVEAVFKRKAFADSERCPLHGSFICLPAFDEDDKNQEVVMIYNFP